MITGWYYGEDRRYHRIGIDRGKFPDVGDGTIIDLPERARETGRFTLDELSLFLDNNLALILQNRAPSEEEGQMILMEE